MIDPRLQRRINLMTARQLADRIADVTGYLHNISPKLARYRELADELTALRAKWREVTDPQASL